MASETHVAKRESLNASLNLPASMMAGGNVTVTTQNNFVPDIAESFDHFFYLNVYAGKFQNHKLCCGCTVFRYFCLSSQVIFMKKNKLFIF